MWILLGQLDLCIEGATRLDIDAKKQYNPHN
jgi:hypothetical protein